MTKIVAISDLHGFLPEEGTIPECDILLIGGDHSPLYNHEISFQRSWFETNFSRWLEEQPAKHIVGIGGNHDYALEGHIQFFGYQLPWMYLHNEDVTIDGIKIWGSPYTNRYGNWASMKTEVGLEQIWKTIPRDIDILLTHGPAYGLGDKVPRYISPRIVIPGYEENADIYVNTGSTTLRDMMPEFKNLKLHISGHLHCDYGAHRNGNILHANVAYCDDNYSIHQPPLVYDWETAENSFEKGK